MAPGKVAVILVEPSQQTALNSPAEWQINDWSSAIGRGGAWHSWSSFSRRARAPGKPGG
jgi:hypothetical protein